VAELVRNRNVGVASSVLDCWQASLSRFSAVINLFCLAASLANRGVH